MNKYYDITQEWIDEVKFMREVKQMTFRGIGEAKNVSDSFVVRVINNQEYYLNRKPKKEYDTEHRKGIVKKKKKIGKICSLCQIQYERPHGYPVACKVCIKHQALKGIKVDLPEAIIPVVRT